MLRTLRDFLKNIQMSKPKISAQILGYASHTIDLQWIITTLEAAKAEQLDVICAYGYGELSPDIEKRLEKAGIPLYKDANSAFIQSIDAPITLTASSGLAKSFFPRRSKWRIHMPHSISSLHVIYPEDAFNGYNVLFSVGPHHCAEYQALAAHHKLNDATSVPCGYGKLTLLKQEDGHRERTEAEPHILIAPSWGQGNILENTPVDLIRGLLEQEYKVSIRPHPSFFIEDHTVIQTLQDTFGENDKFSIEDSRHAGTAIKDADIMISDYSGVAQEFVLMKPRPVVFVDGPQKILNENWEALKIEPIEIRCRGELGPVCGSEPSQIIETIKSVLNQSEDWNDRINQFEKEYLYGRDCEKMAVSYMNNLLNGKVPNA